MALFVFDRTYPKLTTGDVTMEGAEKAFPAMLLSKSSKGLNNEQHAERLAGQYN
jgi:hypothetical protein